MRQYILLCPVCQSTVDAEAEDGQGPQELECIVCGQTWTMEIDSSRQDQFSSV